MTSLGVSENVVYPVSPNGFADHYPKNKWLFHWEYTLFSGSTHVNITSRCPKLFPAIDLYMWIIWWCEMFYIQPCLGSWTYFFLERVVETTWCCWLGACFHEGLLAKLVFLHSTTTLEGIPRVRTHSYEPLQPCKVGNNDVRRSRFGLRLLPCWHPHGLWSQIYVISFPTSSMVSGV